MQLIRSGENKNLGRRLGSILLTLCFMLALCPAMTQQAQAAYDLKVFVNGSSTSTTYDGSESNPFLTIAEAITSVESQTYTAAAIYILPGTYAENLTITQSMSLVGGDASTTIIDGSVDGSSSGRVINISDSSASITIENLTYHPKRQSTERRCRRLQRHRRQHQQRR